MPNQALENRFFEQRPKYIKPDHVHVNGHNLINISSRNQLSQYLNNELKSLLNYSYYFLLDLKPVKKKSYLYLTNITEDERYLKETINLSDTEVISFYNQTNGKTAYKKAKVIGIDSYTDINDNSLLMEQLIANNFKTIILVPLYLHNQFNGVLFFLYKSGNELPQGHEMLIDHLSVQLSHSFWGIHIIEEASEEAFEKDLLFSMFNDINNLQDKNLLLTTVYERLRVLLPFNDIFITLVDHHKKNHLLFLENFEYKRRSHPDFCRFFKLKSVFNDGWINQIMSSSTPCTLSVEDDDSRNDSKEFLDFYRSTSIRQLIGIAMHNGEDEIGAFYITFESETKFSNSQMKLFKAISVYFSLILSNLQSKENIASREFEKSVLLELSGEIALVKDREKLLQALQEKIKKLVPFNDITITLYNNRLNTHSAFLSYSEEKRSQHPDFEEARSTHSPIIDGVVSRTLQSSSPIIFQIDDLLKKTIVPLYIKFYSKTGIQEFVGVSMSNKDGVFGGMYIFSEYKDTYHPKQFGLIKGIANQLSTAVANILAYDEIFEKEREKNILLTISNDMARIRRKEDLIQILHRRLNMMFYFDHAVISLCNLEQNSYYNYSYDPDSKCNRHGDFYNLLKKGYSLEDSLIGEVMKNDFPMVFDIESLLQRKDCPAYIHMNYDCGMKEIIVAQLHSGDKLTGFLMLLLEDTSGLTTSQLELIQGVCYQLSNTIANIIANEESLKRENEKSILLSISNSLAAVRNKLDLSHLVSHRLKDLFPYNHILTMKISADEKWVTAFLMDPNSGSVNHTDYHELETGRFRLNDGILDRASSVGKPIVLDLNELVKNGNMPPYFKFNYSHGIREVVILALNSGIRKTGLLIIFTDQYNPINRNHLSLIHGLSSQLATAMANIIANEKIEKQMLEISNFKKQLEVENLYLQEEIHCAHNYSEIIGTSPVLEKVFKLVSNVASTTSSVLILGETGTGKELIARAIHNASPRRHKVMIKVNCATLPANLIESELFGHEKGAFTGATDKRIGKFELASNSTLFLDEIGEMPLDLQVKLLRALQEREIERVGGRTVIKTDVRVIAATNRDLEKEVQLGNFRSDLYFRLNVFPIFIPPLRERKEDIPILAMHFLAKHSQKAARKVVGFSSKVMKQLNAYNWPGNVRELEHLIERSILLSTHTVINQMNLPGNNQNQEVFAADGYIKTIEELEREHIMNVLQICKGKVAGPGGAAEILKLPSTTLNSKIKKLGIKKEYMG